MKKFLTILFFFVAMFANSQTYNYLTQFGGVVPGNKYDSAKIQDSLNSRRPYKKVSKGLIMGNSTIAAYLCGTNEVGVYLFTAADTTAGNTYYSIATPNDTINGQTRRFMLDANRATYDWAIVEIGLNDLNPSVSIAVTALKYQKMIDTMRLYGNPNMKIVVSAMTPCKQRMIDLMGSVVGLQAWQKYLDLNTAIMGGGAYKITGVDYRVNSHVAVLDDGSGNLASYYNCGDNIHETNEARKIIGNVWRKCLNDLGFLLIQQPQLNVSISTSIGGSPNNYYDAANEAMYFTGSSTFQSLRLQNSNPLGFSSLLFKNDEAFYGGIVFNGSTKTNAYNYRARDLIIYGNKNLKLASSGNSPTDLNDSVVVLNGYNDKIAAYFKNGNTFLLGNASVTGTLGVTGVATLSNNLAVTGNVAVNGSMFNVAGATGNTSINGTVGVNGITTFNSTINVRNGVTVKGGTGQDGYMLVTRLTTGQQAYFGVADSGLISATNKFHAFTKLSGTQDVALTTYDGSVARENLRINHSSGVITIPTGVITAKLSITTGSNATAGTATFSSGSVTINTTAVTSSSLIFVQYIGTLLNIGTTSISTKTAGTSFVVTSSNALDGNSFNWFFVN